MTDQNRIKLSYLDILNAEEKEIIELVLSDCGSTPVRGYKNECYYRLTKDGDKFEFIFSQEGNDSFYFSHGAIKIGFGDPEHFFQKLEQMLSKKIMMVFVKICFTDYYNNKRKTYKLGIRNAIKA